MKHVITLGVIFICFLGAVLLLKVSGRPLKENKSVSSHDNGIKENAEILAEEEVHNDNLKIDSSYAITDSILEICKPAPLSGVPEQIIRKKTYVVSYNKDTKIPNWVAWHLTAEHSDGPIGRSNKFYEDEDVPAPRATLEDYRGSGWSRGHMCPAGDNKWNEEAMYQSFSLINICPQDARLNSGLWNSIEIDCRNWARRFHDIYIVCGPILYRQEHETIGDNQVCVPEAFFKVVLCLNGEPKGMGFVVKNNSGTKKRDLYYQSIFYIRIIGFKRKKKKKQVFLLF